MGITNKVCGAVAIVVLSQAIVLGQSPTASVTNTRTYVDGVSGEDEFSGGELLKVLWDISITNNTGAPKSVGYTIVFLDYDLNEYELTGTVQIGANSSANFDFHHTISAGDPLEKVEYVTDITLKHGSTQILYDSGPTFYGTL